MIDNKFYCDLWQYASVKFENKLLTYYNKFYCDLWRYVSVKFENKLMTYYIYIYMNYYIYEPSLCFTVLPCRGIMRCREDRYGGLRLR